LNQDESEQKICYSHSFPYPLGFGFVQQRNNNDPNVAWGTRGDGSRPASFVTPTLAGPGVGVHWVPPTPASGIHEPPPPRIIPPRPAGAPRRLLGGRRPRRGGGGHRGEGAHAALLLRPYRAPVAPGALSPEVVASGLRSVRTFRWCPASSPWHALTSNCTSARYFGSGAFRPPASPGTVGVLWSAGGDSRSVCLRTPEVGNRAKDSGGSPHWAPLAPRASAPRNRERRRSSRYVENVAPSFITRHSRV